MTQDDPGYTKPERGRFRIVIDSEHSFDVLGEGPECDRLVALFTDSFASWRAQQSEAEITRPTSLKARELPGPSVALFWSPPIANVTRYHVLRFEDEVGETLEGPHYVDTDVQAGWRPRLRSSPRPRMHLGARHRRQRASR